MSEKYFYRRRTAFHLIRIQTNWCGNSIKSINKDWIDDVAIIVRVKEDCINIHEELPLDSGKSSSFHNSRIRWCSDKQEKFNPISSASPQLFEEENEFRFTLYLFCCRLSESRLLMEVKFVCFWDVNEM